jgi:hypothetical protein
VRGGAYQVLFPPPVWLLAPDVARDVDVVPVVAVVVVTAAGTSLQKLVNQLWRLDASAGLAAQAASQTPVVPDLKAARRGSLQKQLS